MPHERRFAPRGAWLALLAGLLLTAGSSHAQSLLRGVAEVQYQNVNRVVPADDRESWGKTFQIDYSTRFRKTLELSSQFQFSQLDYTGRPERTRTPRGSLRLAHPVFGLFASYRPVTVTDERNYTSKQQETMLSAYFQKVGLPRVVGSWSRRHLDPTATFPGSASVTRNVTANYDLGRLNFHGGWGDQGRRADIDRGPQSVNDHWNLGSAARLEGRRATGNLQYEFLQTRSRNGGTVNDVSRVHMAGMGGSYQISRRTSGSLSYSFRHTSAQRPGAIGTAEHEGGLNVGHQLTKALQVSGGGGVRSAAVGERKETESYVVASASADAQARPGWRVGAGASHSVNWLPGDRGRPVDSFRSNTSMILAKGLEVTGDLGITSSSRPVPRTDTALSPTQATLTTGAGIRATPLPRVNVNASTRHYQTSSSVWKAGPSLNSHSVDLLLRPSDALQMGGGWALSSTPGTKDPDRTTVRANVQWNLARSVEASGSYTRASQGVRDPGTALGGNREAYGGRLLVALTRDLHATIQYSEADPGRSTHARQVNVTVTQSFGR